MSFRLQFSIEGEQQLSRKLLIMADKVKDWSPAFEETAGTLKELFSGEVFGTQGAIIEESWAPLSRAYAARKEKRYPGKGLLEATGSMRNGFMTMWRPDMAQVWNQVEYFKYHQSNQPRTIMPRRVMMKIANNQKEQIVKIFQSYFQQIISSS